MSKRVDRVGASLTTTSSKLRKQFREVQKKLEDQYGIDGSNATFGIAESERKLFIYGVSKKAVAHIPDEFEVDGIKVIKKIVGRART